MTTDETRNPAANDAPAALHQSLAGMEAPIAALQQEATELRTLFTALHDFVLVLDATGCCRAVAPGRPEIQARFQATLLNRTLHQVYPAAYADRYLAAIHQALTTGQPVNIAFTLPGDAHPARFKGMIRPFAAATVVLAGHENSASYPFETAAYDTLLLAHVRDAVIATDLHGIVTYWNDRATRLYGWTAPEMLGCSLLERLPPTSRTAFSDVIEQICDGGEFVSEWEIYRKDGQPIWIDAQVRLITDAAGRAIGVMSLSHDITARKRAEAALRTSEEQYRMLADYATDMISRHSIDGRYLYVSPASERILGYPPAELVGRLAYDFFHPDDIAAIRQNHEMIINTSDTVGAITYRLRRKDGSYAWIETTSRTIRDTETGAPTEIIAVSRDVTARRKAAEALRASEARYRLITENSSDLITIIDMERRFVYISPSVRPLLGYEPQSLIGTDAMALIHPEDMAHITRSWSQANQRHAVPIAFRYRHHDGGWRWFEGRGARVEQQGTQYALVVSTDVTERRNLESQLIQAQKMEGIGRLAGGVAHDFNNLLVVISGCADLARETLAADDPVQYDLREIQQAAGRAANLTRQLLAFARRQVSDPQIINLNDLVSDMDKLLRRLIREDISLITLTSADLWPVRVDPGQIEQVIVNLAVNARDAMPDGGILTIETSNVQLSAEFAREHVAVAPGPYVMLAVTDTGVGMSEEVKRHAFEPFYTTKGPGQGTGLGLATCYGIVKQHSGTIWLYSEPGRGSSIKIYLPRTEGATIQLPPRNRVEISPHGSETVLLVEDEPAVRALAGRILRSQGYTVLEAGGGEEAQRVAANYEDAPIHLLVTDMVLPEMSGRDIAQHLIHQTPDLKVLFMSGYTDNTVIHLGRLEPGMAFLQKPFTPAALSRKVREILDS